MNRFNISNSILLIFCFPFLFLQCCKSNNECPAVPTYCYDLTADQNSKVPYNGHSTLIFVSNNNDTVSCIGIGKEDIYDVNNLSEHSPECEPNKRKDEKIVIEFNSDKTQLLDGLKIGLYKKLYDIAIPFSDAIAIGCNSKVIATEIRFMTTTYFTDTVYTCNGTKENIGKITDDGGVNIVYYNTSKGILAIKNDRFWRILI